jgi:hypothetical protein
MGCISCKEKGKARYLKMVEINFAAFFMTHPCQCGLTDDTVDFKYNRNEIYEAVAQRAPWQTLAQLLDGNEAVCANCDRQA